MVFRWLLAITLAAVLLSCGSAENRRYRIGRDELFYPADLDNKYWETLAFSDDLLQEIAQREKIQISLYPAVWQRFWYLIHTEQLDAVLSPIPDVPSNRDYYEFSDAYLFVGPVLVSRVEATYGGIEDLRGAKVAVPLASDWLLTVSAVPDILLVDYGFAPQALQDLADGKVDGVIMAAIPAYAILSDHYQGILRVVTPPLTNEGIRLLTKKGRDKELIEAFNRGLKALIEDGTYDRLQRKWHLDLEEGPSPVEYMPTK